jgi:hypothetical protein
MPMTRQQAELAVDRDTRLRGLGPNREAAIRKVMQMDPDQLVSNVPAGSPLARPATRQTAISAAMGGPEEPRMVTPATPAPMRPGIPIMAPRPEARQLMPADVRQMAAREEAGMAEPEAAPAPALAPVRAAPAAAASGYVSPMRLAMKETERELSLLNYNRKRIADEGKPENPELELAINLVERRLDQQRSIANAEEGAAIDPERAALLARQEGRIKGQEERVGREEKNALSDALIKGGLALMNPQRGANFLAALSGGLGQGLETYDTAKTKAVEARARLGAETDALALQKFDALDKARAVARQSILEGKQIDERELRMAGMTNEQMEKTATLAARIEEKIANARKATTEANYAPLMFESEMDVNAARATDYRTGSGSRGGDAGGAGTLPPGARLETEGRLATAYAEQDEAYQNWVAAGKPILGEVKQGDKKWLAASKYEAARGKVNNLLGALGRPKLGAPPTRRAAARPAAPTAAGPKSAKPKGFPGTQAAWDVMTPAEKKLFQ